MGCAIKRDWFSIILDDADDNKIIHQPHPFNGRLLRQAREFEGYDFDEFAKKTGFGFSRLNDFESGLRQPSDAEINTIHEFIPGFLRSFYYQRTVRLDEPNIVFMCGEGIRACESCGEVADYLCDYPVGDGKLCSLPVCEQCRTRIGQYDFCPVHKVINQVIKVIEN